MPHEGPSGKGRLARVVWQGSSGENEANDSDDNDSYNFHDSDSEHNNHDDSASSHEPVPTDKERLN